MKRGGRIVYLFTTFPVATETFLQREVRGLREHGLDLELVTLWGGGTRFEGLRVRRFNRWRLAWAILHLGYWVVREPVRMRELLEAFLCAQVPSALNFLENLAGVGFAVLEARRYGRERPVSFHGVWGSMPSAAALVLSELTGVGYSMGAHAYDVFEYGGDWILAEKLRRARFVHTSTRRARARLLALGAGAQKVVLIRRSLGADAPEFKALRCQRDPVRLLWVGRLVEKKGPWRLLAVLRALQRRGLAFEVVVAGDGPLREALLRGFRESGLGARVDVAGQVSFARVQELYAWADALLFTGLVAETGDRDGLPNVIAEAMAAGVVVLASDTGGVREAVNPGATGYLFAQEEPIASWVRAVRELMRDEVLCERLREGARAWVGEHFDARRNARALALEHVGETGLKGAKEGVPEDGGSEPEGKDVEEPEGRLGGPR